MLKQYLIELKDQFKDKTDILDETRKNLFVVDEQRLVLQKELDEIKNFSGHAFVDDLTDNFMKLSADYQTKIEDLSSEVELLTQIISKTSSCYQN